MVNLAINDFTARFKGGVRKSLFRARIANWPAALAGASDKLTFSCKIANLPASTLSVIEVPYLGRKIKVPGNRTFENWTITVIADEDYLVRDSLIRWGNAINTHFGNVSILDIPSQFLGDLEVEQYSRTGEILQRITIHDAFPATLQEMELGWEDADALGEFTQEFAYTYWTHDTGVNGSGITDRASGSSTFSVDVGVGVLGI